MVFLGMWEVQDDWGKIHTFLLAMQVGFTHLLYSQRDKITFFVFSTFIYKDSLASLLVSRDCHFNKLCNHSPTNQT
jgi:hypothetical protein